MSRHSPSRDGPPASESRPPAAARNALQTALARLYDELEHTRTALGSLSGTDLKEANAGLVIAALRSDAIAEDALRSLSELAHRSHRDLLTGIPNRALMQEHLDAAIATSRRAHAHFAVFFVDFDHFRQVNRGLGHAAGDKLLQLGALRLGSAIRDSDTLSRHGGDEFLALVTGLDTPGDAVPVARKMLAALAEPASVGGHPLVLSASIGIAIYPEDGEDAATLVKHADAAMYRSKSSAPGGFCFFRESDTSAGRTDSTATVAAGAAAAARLDDLREANTELLMAALKAQEEELQLRHEQQRQVRFMAMVAHELRHPLTPLKLATDLLADGDSRDSDAMTRLHAIINQQVAHMSRVIGDLLDGTRIHAGKLKLRRQTLDLVALLGAVAEGCRPMFLRRQQSLRLALPPGPVNFYGDPVRLTQVFGNLLDNASKYSPEGGEIVLELCPGAGTRVVTVSDAGIGIAADALEAVFGLFVQDERAAPHAQGGIGVGLAVVRELVEAHGGTVTVSSDGIDRGSRFVVTLPDGAPDDAAPPG
ncbi:histidine kinase [Dyella thiooxydans]|uniref:histidine kinase n=1 Tax=Dyella thiooxydans TaxID=445710 RepID=A0A160N2I7_9GAMM|nr:diguanylate cyclase [Dyella thiooxydans]AND70116.1 histidine kinase [Dyella thiooxydans]